MRSSSIVAATLFAGVFAVPYQRRSLVTETDLDVVYVTDVVTVTEHGSPAASPTEEPKKHKHHFGNWGWGTTTATSQINTEPTETPVSPSEQTVTKGPKPTPSPPTEKQSRPSPSQVQPLSGGAVPTSYAEVAVYAHNQHRRNHSAPDIKWSDSLAQSAQIIAESCIYEHNVSVMGGGYGQNIAAGVKPANISAVITNLFYNGEVNWFAGYYGMAQPPMTNFGHWGHFSQVVWKKSTQLGCYTSYCPNGLANTGGAILPYFTVCNYKGAGNYANEYGVNIGAPIGLPTANWDTGLNIGDLPTL